MNRLLSRFFSTNEAGVLIGWSLVLILFLHKIKKLRQFPKNIPVPLSVAELWNVTRPGENAIHLRFAIKQFYLSDNPTKFPTCSCLWLASLLLYSPLIVRNLSPQIQFYFLFLSRDTIFFESITWTINHQSKVIIPDIYLSNQC